MATCSISELIDDACASGFKCLDEQTFRGLVLQLLCNLSDSPAFTVPIPVTDGGTGTTTEFTPGSVVFAGAAGVYTQDNANLFFDNTNNRLMVATNTAYTDAIGTASLTVNGLSAANGFQIPATNSGATAGVIVQAGSVVFHTFGSAGGSGANIFIGNVSSRAGNFTTTGIGANIGIGANALTQLTSGTRNMAIGGSCLQNCNSGANNVGVGEASVFGVTTGSDNVGIGQSGGRAISTGGQNTFIGGSAGYTDGSNATPNNISNSCAIGYQAQVSASNSMCLGSIITPVKVGIGVFTPTARMHLPAGTTAASSAPLKFTSGTNMTTAETGAMEYNGTNLLFTRSGTTRENVLMSSTVTTEVVVSDTTVTVNIGGTTIKLLARA